MFIFYGVENKGLMILQNALTRESNVIYYYWTLFSKAYDKVPHLHKLCYYGIHGAYLS